MDRLGTHPFILCSPLLEVIVLYFSWVKFFVVLQILTCEPFYSRLLFFQNHEIHENITLLRYYILNCPLLRGLEGATGEAVVQHKYTSIEPLLLLKSSLWECPLSEIPLY